ncbi:MAG: TRAP transporter substrate-binding protein [Deltaproteobacteria bacterium]|jgi:TRAP-type mannitol/chloroaromatic compound transport system substrate-binding protein|nr:TRAP transporter substrate-binding protein [Deltaproteobacteria bacterium]MBW2470163.1 TRAP transporter substrate-binding protein [Deltaproteobacteria bacterium]MBW2486931.1 TRAP transporter substrate-binding protein [Deltaproteobacteria bacterium]MBW2518374.1 TRAP transporter substrate-binding protein [Deltaproteobacteria bacterium]
MKRRDFLKKAGIGAASAAAAAAGVAGLVGCAKEEEKKPEKAAEKAPAVVAPKTYKWRMVTTWPPKLPVLQEGCERLAQRVNEMSDGRLTIEVFAGGELVPPLESFQAVSDGTVEVGSGASYYWAGKEPATQWFAAVPFGMNAQGMGAWFHGGDGLKLWEETYAPFNLIPRPGGSTGVQMGGWFNKKINTIDDYKGLKMRIPGLGGKVVAKAGGTVVLLPGGEIFTSLERGVIDATEWVGPLHDLRMGFYQAAQYYYYPGWHEPGTYLEYFFNKKAYESLPKDLQHIVNAACMENEQWTLTQFDAQNGAALQTLINEHKVEVIQFPDEVLAALRKMAVEVVQEEAAKSPMATKVAESFAKFQKVVGTWGSVSERAYFNVIQEAMSLKG